MKQTLRLCDSAVKKQHTAETLRRKEKNKTKTLRLCASAVKQRTAKTQRHGEKK
jgi:uncharacterized protein YqeY